jgi:hypothetical protein
MIKLAMRIGTACGAPKLSSLALENTFFIRSADDGTILATKKALVA